MGPSLLELSNTMREALVKETVSRAFLGLAMQGLADGGKTYMFMYVPPTPPHHDFLPTNRTFAPPLPSQPPEAWVSRVCGRRPFNACEGINTDQCGLIMSDPRPPNK
jgi:hypothetical protein